MKLCTGFVWFMIRYRSGFCKHGKEVLSSTTWTQNVQMFQNDTDVSGLQS